MLRINYYVRVVVEETIAKELLKILGVEIYVTPTMCCVGGIPRQISRHMSNYWRIYLKSVLLVR